MERIGEHREELAARVRLVAGTVGLALAVVVVAFFFIQVVRGAHYLDLAENNRLRRVAIDASRGTITDRNGRVLVENLPSYRLSIDRGQPSDLDSSLSFAGSVLGVPVTEMRATLDSSRRETAARNVLLAENLSLSEVARIRVARLEHPEFEVEVVSRRFYRLGAHAAHVLGYLGEVRREELNQNPERYRFGDWVGRRGVERTYDAVLRGQRGERVVAVDSRGFPVEEIAHAAGRPGSDLQLTLDADLQQEAERLIAGQVGAIVALDPRDGAVRALVSAPAYDPNLFARTLAAADWQALIDDPRHPLQNRALASTYSPGSVFKIVIAAAGLTEQLITPAHTEFCGGYGSFYGRRFHCWKRGGHGRLDLEGAMQHSCDIYFYHLGQRLGIERIAKYARLFGLGSVTGIDLAGERRGLVPDQEWSLRARRHPWYPGETISVAIGQGALLATPIQMATMLAAVANGGRHVTPYLSIAGTSPQRALEIPTSVIEIVRRGLWRVVNEAGGTGASARLPGIEIAGKTGTTQVVSQEAFSDSSQLPWERRNHAWFASYAPAARPELVIVVFIEHGGQGSRAAAPIAKALYAHYFGSRLDLPAQNS